MNEKEWLKHVSTTYFLSLAHLASSLCVSRQYIYAVYHGQSPLSKRIKRLIIDAIIHKKKLDRKLLAPTLGFLDVNNYFIQKFGRPISYPTYLKYIKEGRLHACKNSHGHWEVSSRSLKKLSKIS